jgi:hypothetical protein
MPWVVWTVTNWYLCSWHTLWRIWWPVFMLAFVIPDPQVIYFTRDVKYHLITWIFITASSVATFGVTLKKVMQFQFVCFIWYAVCGLLMLMNWLSDSCFCVFWTCITAYCRLWKLLSSVCKTLFTHRSFGGVFVIADTMVINETLVPTKSWWFAWRIPLGILRKLLYCHARFSLMKSSHTKCLFWTRCHFALLMNSALLVARMHCKLAA